jgi:uncharacterized membrane protein YkvA (DUF1232 family)
LTPAPRIRIGSPGRRHPENRGKLETVKIIEILKTRTASLKKELTAAYYAARDDRMPLVPKILLAVALGYALSPIDLIPDWIPVLGYLDDLLLLPALISLAIRLVPEDLMEDARKKAAEKPVKLRDNWLFAAVFILLWAVVAWTLIAALIRIFVN